MLTKQKYPLDQDYEHFDKCETRLQDRSNECNRCRYVWDHWYRTTLIQFNRLGTVKMYMVIVTMIATKKH
jgi:hypothetical protein